jgi:signal transduction histidine kinase
MRLKDFLDNNRETIQLVYGVVLIVLIPLLIVVNTVFIIGKYNRGIDVALQRQALSVGRTISALMQGDLPWNYFIQAKLDLLVNNNSEIMELKVLKPEGDDFKIVASSRTEEIDQVSSSYYYRLAWAEKLNDAIATESLALENSAYGSEVLSPGEEERYWLVTMPMGDVDGNKQALLSIKLSSEIVDQLTQYNRNASIMLLVGTVFVVILFLLVAVRLWDYALLYKKIKEIDKMKDEFISVASHELRTPVTAIRGYASMIADGSMGAVNEKVKQSAKLILHSADRLVVLVGDLLDVSRIEQGRFKMNLHPVNPNQTIGEVVEELSVNASKKKLVLNFHPYTERLPAINIDKDRFKQVLINLIGNAIKYTPEGSVDIEMGEVNRGKSLEIKIKDTGIGISGKEKARLFEKFYRVNSDKTKDITGTGLGLWITKQIVEMMGGSIEIESIEDVGTQVILQFPIIRQ